MHVGMDPEQPGGMVRRNVHVVVERLISIVKARIRHCRQLTLGIGVNINVVAICWVAGSSLSRLYDETMRMEIRWVGAEHFWHFLSMLGVRRGRRQLINEADLKVVALVKLQTHAAVLRGGTRVRRTNVVRRVAAITDFIDPRCWRVRFKRHDLHFGRDEKIENTVGTREGGWV